MAVLVPRETPRTWKLQEVLVTEPGVIRRGNRVYAYFEPTIRKVFFAGLSETAGTIATFGYSPWRS
jgi:MFS transporter, MHS family, proline/betaine transporter